jgi:hypothetical protein
MEMMMKSIRHLIIILFVSFTAGIGKTQITGTANPGVLQIADASLFSQVVAISDIHGMFDNLVTLLRAGRIIDGDNNWIAGRTLLIVTGDSIDKGPNSIEVLNLFIQLQNQSQAVGGQVLHLLGNHEAEFLADPQGDSKATELLNEMAALHIPLSDLTSTSSPRGRFLHEEPVAARVGKWLFSHSGYYPDMTWQEFSTQARQTLANQNYGDNFLIGDGSILEARKWELDSASLSSLLGRLDMIGDFGAVFGHQPGAFGIRGRSAAKAGGRLIKIDNGMAPEAGSNAGSLLVFVNPQQMNRSVFPQIKTIYPDGSEQILLPE